MALSPQIQLRTAPFPFSLFLMTVASWTFGVTCIPDTAAFTWMRSDGTLSSRIDLIGCPIPWVHCVKSCEILPCPYSDHSAVLLVCPIPTPLPRGPGRWKMNISILKEQEFVSLVEDFWKSWRLRKPSSSLHSWWDRGKEHIKSIAIRFCLGKQAERKDLPFPVHCPCLPPEVAY